MSEHEVVLDPLFFKTIQQLRQEGWLWVINTGRSLLHMLEGFTEARFPFAPDYLVVREREMYTVKNASGRWERIEDWHQRYKRDSDVFFAEAEPFLQKVKDYVELETQAQWIEEDEDPAGLITTSEAETAQVVAFVEKYRHESPSLGYLRNTIYMRFTHKNYHKGSSLREIARLEKVSEEQVFAIGDGHNDLDMLHPEVAAMIACVGNADQEVKEYVQSHQGYIAQQEGSRGTMEALEHFLGASHLPREE